MKKLRLKTIIVSAAAVVLVSAAVLLLLFGGAPHAKLTDAQLRVYTFFFYNNISYEEINNVELADTLTYGSRSPGFAWPGSKAGTYTNYELGIYELCVYEDTERYIIVHHDGGICVFNLETEQDTVDFYVALRQTLRSHNGMYEESSNYDLQGIIT